MIAQTHPELERRWNLLVGRTWMFGTELWIESATRSRETQADLYARWKAGTYLVPVVADPDRVLGPSPWGWPLTGSFHMVQADGYSHALDIGWRGLDDEMMRSIALSCGLYQPEAREKWHFQWWDTYNGVYPVRENPTTQEDDMTPQQLAMFFGPSAVLGDDGVCRLPLATDNAIELGTDEVEMHPIGDVLKFMHREAKTSRMDLERAPR